MTIQFVRNLDDCRTRGAEARHGGRAPISKQERNKRRRAGRSALVAEMMLNKNGPRAGAVGNGNTDLFVVPRADLLAQIGPTLDKQTKEALGSPDIIIGGYLYLASELGVHPDVVRKMFLNSHLPWVSFGLADDILAVLGMSMSLPVYVNPRISYKTWCKRAEKQDVDSPALTWLLHSHPEAWAA